MNTRETTSTQRKCLIIRENLNTILFIKGVVNYNLEPHFGCIENSRNSVHLLAAQKPMTFPLNVRMVIILKGKLKRY